MPESANGVKVDPKNLSLIQKVLRPLPPLGRNTFLLSLLGGGALGSFVMSTTAGKIACNCNWQLSNLLLISS
jgi:hypothetical protein